MSDADTSGVRRTIEDFLARVSPFDPEPDGGPAAVLELRGGTVPATYELTAHVVRALRVALDHYQDPSDRGPCEWCASRRIDDNFICRDCGRPNGVFGRMLMERAATYGGDPPAITEPS